MFDKNLKKRFGNKGNFHDINKFSFYAAKRFLFKRVHGWYIKNPKKHHYVKKLFIAIET